MQKQEAKKILKCIESVYLDSKRLIQDENSLEIPDKNLDSIANYFSINRREAFIVAIIFIMNFSNNRIKLTDLTDLFPNNLTDILLFRKELESLVLKGVLKKGRHNREQDLFGVNYCINQSIVLDILENLPFNTNKCKEADIYSLLETIGNLIENYDEEDDEIRVSSGIIVELIEKNQDIPFLKAILDLKLGYDSNIIYLYLIWCSLDRQMDVDASYLLKVVYPQAAQRFRVMQSIFDGTNVLISEDLVMISNNYFLNDLSLKLSEKSIALALQYGIRLDQKMKLQRLTIKSTEIKKKQLIFSKNEMSHLETLKTLLKDDNFEKSRNNLIERNFNEGITAIFYGAPGTGKTESVLQIARESKREIMKVDISQTKSMWFGESEKMVKKIFNEYYNIQKDIDRVPLLFLNEADALISKRDEKNSSNTKQTENTIQNILLEELENFRGILFATTNLIGNLDNAFERRFLFKIRFPEPDCEIRAQIWKLKIPTLKDYECKNLAQEFNLSGGQIDNIVKKLILEESVNCKSLSIEQIVNLCNVELFYRKEIRRRIGFKRLSINNF